MPQSPQEDARRFLHPATIGRIGRLEIRARQVVEGFIAGLHKSPVFGHSIEFLQHREYTHGDDIRHLDWKVWSRTDRYVIKPSGEAQNVKRRLFVGEEDDGEDERLHHLRTHVGDNDHELTEVVGVRGDA